MAQALTPEQLLTQAARNDPSAMAELYDRLAPEVLGMLVRILPAREAAEEVLQEAFTRLWEKSGSLAQQGGSVGAWLVVVAHALAVGRLREERAPAGGPAKTSRRETPRAARPKSAPSRAAKDHGVESIIVGSLAWVPCAKEIARIDARRELLRKVLRQLPKPQGETLDLALFGGYTELEIAQQRGEPLGKVNSALRAAMTFLRHRLHAVTGTWTANV